MIFPILFAATLQLQAATPPVHHGIHGGTDIRLPAASADSGVVIDGRLGEAVWQRAEMLTGFSLYQPVDGRPAPDSTEILVWYSPTAIYFGIRAYEPHGPVRATLADRDRVGSDDNVEIHIDTYSERRRAYVFIVNPLGIQADGTKTEGGGFIPGSNVSPGQNDLSPDFIWQSKGHVTDWGYEVEVRIPFNSLRYASETDHRWGLQFNRRVQHSGYDETWTPVKKANASFISQEGWISGLKDLQHGPSITLNPELTNTIQGSPPAAAAIAAGKTWDYKASPRIGGNIRFGIGSNFVLNGTVKPDFSQVEADAAQVAADPRFALFYAERRPFFVEGSEQFNVPNTLVYTRRIVSPDGALKLTGKVGRTNVALLSALDAPVVSATSTKDRPLVDILRLTRDFGAQNTLGMLYSDRVRDDRSNRVAGGDVRYVFGKLYYAQLQLAGSATQQSGTTRKGELWEAVVDRTGRNYGFHYNVVSIAPNFQADNGFVSRTGYVQSSASNRYTIFGKQGGVFERYNVFLTLSALWRYYDFRDAKSSLENRASVNNSFTFKRGWSLSITPAIGNFAFDPNAYAGLRTGSSAGALSPFLPSDRTSTFTTAASVSTPQFRRFAASGGFTLGNDVYFLETSRARRAAYNASLDMRPNERIRLNATYVSTKLTRRAYGDIAQSSRIPRVKLEYQVSRPLFVRFVAQYEATEQSALRDPRTGNVLWQGTTPNLVPSTKSNTLRADALISYRPKPGIVLFGGYGNTMAESDPLAFDRLRRVSDGIFAKASYVFGQLPR
ncbi:MAG: DUF5916 domain-containing protein [Gemmatimonadaceae bacterium]